MLFTLPYKNQLTGPFNKFIKAGIYQETLLEYRIRTKERDISVKIEMDATVTEGVKRFPLYILTTTDEETHQKAMFSPKEFSLLWDTLTAFATHGDNSKLNLI
jgi:hypothetical protein